MGGRRAGMDTEEMRKLLPIPGIEPSFVKCPARNIVTIPTVLSRLPMYDAEKPNIIDDLLFVNASGCVT